MIKKEKHFLTDNTNFFLEKLKGQLESEEISEPKLILKLKMEISSLISLEIVTKGRPFSDGVFIKQLFQKNLAKA